MKSLSIALFLAVVASLPGCGGKQEAPRSDAGPTVPGVAIETVQLVPTPEEYEAVGTVRAKNTTVLSSRAMGTVVSIPVREGDRVKAGQTLAEIDSRDTQAQADKAQAGSREAHEALGEIDSALKAADHGLEAARANRDLAASTFLRFKTLAERGAVSRQEFEEAEARQKAAAAELARAAEMKEALVSKRGQVLAKIDQAKADVSGARVALTYSRLSAPVSGVIVAKHAEVGALAAPGAPLLTLEDDSRYRLEAQVDESFGTRIHLGSVARVRLDSLGDREVSGKVEEISPTADASTRSYVVKIGLEKFSGLRSGLFGRAWFSAGEKRVLLVPKGSLMVRGQLASVLVVGTDHLARLRLVTMGKEQGARVEILSGLAPGERIVVAGAERVSDGARVE